MTVRRPILSRVIRASAGTGKTYQLTRQFIRLLAEPETGQQPERILAMTFSRAAAGEIRDRLIAALADAATDPESYEQLAHALPADCKQERVASILLGLLRRLDRLRVSTIDSFFIQLAKTFALDLDLPVDWSIGDTRELEALRADALDALLGTLDPAVAGALFSELRQGQAPVGLARTLTAIVRSGYGVARETSEAAWQWRFATQRLDGADRDEAVQALQAAAFEGTASFDGARIKDLERFEGEQWKSFLDTGIAKKVHEGAGHYGSKGNVIDEQIRGLYEPLVHHAAAELLDGLSVRTRQMRAVVMGYAETLRAERQRVPLYGFDDIAYRLAVAQVLGLLDTVYYRLDGAIDHLLLDEFQDTSLTQWGVLRPLASTLAAGGDRPRSLMVVGDAKQSLYGWRGGRPELLERIVEQLPSLAVEPERLDLSRRASPAIIRAVNATFDGIAQNQALEGDASGTGAEAWQGMFAAHETVHEGRDGAVEVRVFDDKETRFEETAELVGRLHRDHPGLTIGVLVRANQGGEIASVVRCLQALPQPVACSGEGGNPLTDSVAVTLLMSLLTLIDHPGHTIARFHVWRSPLRALFGTDLGEEPDEAAVGEWTTQARRRLLEDGYGPCLSRWAGALAHVADEHDRVRLGQLIEHVTTGRFAATLRPSDCVDEIRETRIASPKPAPVQVMTIHRAKGLQFGIVVLCDLDRPLYRRDDLIVWSPDPLAPPERVCSYVGKLLASLDDELTRLKHDWEAEQTQSALSVLYVAMTRAQHGLYMLIEPQKKVDPKQTMAGILRGALVEEGTPVDPGTVLFADPRPGHRWTSPPRAAAAPVDLPPPWTPPPPSGPSARGRPTTSPSRLEGDAVVRGETVLRPRPTQRLDRGTVVHGWCEIIGWLDDGAPVLDDLLGQVADVGVDPTTIAAWATEFLAALERPTLRSLLTRPSDGHQYEVFNEQRFELTVPPDTRFAHRTLGEAHRLVGSMDRMVIRRGEGAALSVQVIDYKTDHVDPSDAEAINALAHRYGPQLASYRYAAARLVGCQPEQVLTQLMLLHCDRLVDVP